MQTQRQIQRLRDPNPMVDVPDQDSAKNPQTFENLFLQTRAMLGNRTGQPTSIHLPGDHVIGALRRVRAQDPEAQYCGGPGEGGGQRQPPCEAGDAGNCFIRVYIPSKTRTYF